MVQEDMAVIDKLSLNINYDNKESVYCNREVIIKSLDNLNIDLITITDVNGMNKSGKREPYFKGLFPNNDEEINVDSLVKKIHKISINSTDDINEIKKSHENIIMNKIKEINDENNNENGNKDDNLGTVNKSSRPFVFDGKEVVFISARVHPGEVHFYLYIIVHLFMYVYFYLYIIIHLFMYVFDGKEVVFISARVHPGEVFIYKCMHMKILHE
jgi:hypothetical protein